MTLSIVTLIIMQTQSVFMLSVIYAVSLMLSVTYAECHLCLVSLMFIVTNKPFMLSVVKLSIAPPY
jgi:hypothetical protein